MRPAYIWTPRDSTTRLEAMRELLAKARAEEAHHGEDMGRHGVSAAAQSVVVAARAAAAAASRYARALVGRRG